jgi:hypothetical protein
MYSVTVALHLPEVELDSARVAFPYASYSKLSTFAPTSRSGWPVVD